MIFSKSVGISYASISRDLKISRNGAAARICDAVPPAVIVMGTILI
jgi:hypothetical protein